MSYQKCIECNRNAIFNKNLCVMCSPHQAEGTRCYSCDLCIATREFLRETNQQFVMVGYSSDGYELWNCEKCGYDLLFIVTDRTIIGDMSRELNRRQHMEDCGECYRVNAIKRLPF